MARLRTGTLRPATMFRGAIVLSGLLLAGCDRIATLRHPELATCQRFIRSRMRVPSSFHRTWHLISDTAVSRPLLAEAIGDAPSSAVVRDAPNPAIRDVFVQYDADDGLGGRVKAAANCLFALVDDGRSRYARDIESSVDAAIRENEARTLMVSMGKEGVVSADCCLANGFDPKKLAGLKQRRRGSIVAAPSMARPVRGG